MNSKSVLLFGSVFAAVFGGILYVFLGLDPDHPMRVALNRLVNGDPDVQTPSTRRGTGKPDTAKDAKKDSSKDPKKGDTRFVAVERKDEPHGRRSPPGSRRLTQQRTIWKNKLGDGFEYLKQNKLLAAEKNFLDRLREVEEFDPTIDKDVAEDQILILSYLGQTESRLNRLKEAEEYYRRALEIARDSAYKDEPVEMSRLQANLAQTLYITQKYKEAEQLCSTAVSTQAKYLNENDPELGICVGLLGEIYVRENKLEEAERMLKRSLDIRRKNRERSPGEFCQSLIDLAYLYQLLNQPDKEGALLREAVDASASFAPNDPQILVNQSRLALFYRKQKKYAEAEPLLVKVISTYGEKPIPDGEIISSYQVELAAVEVELGKTEEAEKLLATASARQQLIYQEPTNPKLLPALEVKLALYKKTNRGKEAAAVEEQIKRIKDAIEEKRKEKEAAEKADQQAKDEAAKPEAKDQPK